MNPLSSARGWIAISEPEQAALCVPTFSRRDLEPGQAWCIRGQHAMDLKDFLEAKPCPERTT